MSRGIKRWIISDTHFGHTNVIKYGKRPFNNKQEMDEFIINKWNNTVGKYDKVYHLGDFSFGDKAEFKEIVSRLNGNIILIKGNHDTRSNKFYMDSGIFEVSSNPILLTINDIDFILSHHPLTDSRYRFAFNLHGHIHNEMLSTEGVSTYNFSCEAINYTPVNLDEFAEQLNKEEY